MMPTVVQKRKSRAREYYLKNKERANLKSRQRYWLKKEREREERGEESESAR